MFQHIIGLAGYAGPADASSSSVLPCAADEIAAARHTTAVAAAPLLPVQADDAALADEAERPCGNAVAADAFAPAQASKRTVKFDLAAAPPETSALPAFDARRCETLACVSA